MRVAPLFGPLFAALCLASLVACDAGDKGDGGDEGGADSADPDGDGFTGEEDCDEANPEIHAGASEHCDGVDQDCDGETDEEPVDGDTFYTDNDSDGYGDATRPVISCAGGAGMAENATDCADGDETIHPGADEQDCTDPIDYNCDGSTGFSDNDLDGVPACDDCNDGDDTIHPGATEICNGADDDCNNAIDDAAPENSVVWYMDSDGDEHGDASFPAAQCEAPEGYVASDDDCDDGEATIYPGAAEICDEFDVDEDCDSLSDEADDSLDPTSLTDWYVDNDTDGYGSGSSTTACDAPTEAHVGLGGDCEDGVVAINPGATELCDLLDVDEDCDGLVDDLDGSTDPTTMLSYYQDGDGDHYGSSSATLDACDLPSGYALVGGDCDDTTITIRPGSTEICDSADADEDCDGLTDNNDPSTSSSGKSSFYVDSDSDGYGTSVFASYCDKPTGYATVDGDCDDTNSSISPAGTEICDASNADEDCDTVTDDADSSVSTATYSTWYRDADSDSYGATATTKAACDKPTGYASLSGDCDDSSKPINPGATEICDSGNTDEDCDGLADNNDSSASSSGKSTFYSDADSDGYGASSGSAAYCDLPTGYSSLSTDCDDGAIAVNPAATEVCDLIDNNCDFSTDEGLTGTWYPDDDGDSFGDRESSATTGCPPSAYVADHTDCNDTNADVLDCGFPAYSGVVGSSWTSRASSSWTTSLGSMNSYWLSEETLLFNFYSSPAQYYDPSANLWSKMTTTNPLSSSYFAGGAPYDGYLWVIRKGKVYRYDPIGDVYATAASFTMTDDKSMTESDEYGVIYGYDGSGELITYDTVTSTLTETSSGLGALTQTRLAYDPTNRWLFLGAYNGAALYRYDIEAGTYTAVTPIPESQLNDSFCSDRSGHIYAAGGTSGTTIYQYTTDTDTWTTITAFPMSHANAGSCTVSDDGYLYVSSGSASVFYRIALY